MISIWRATSEMVRPQRIEVTDSDVAERLLLRPSEGWRDSEANAWTRLNLIHTRALLKAEAFRKNYEAWQALQEESAEAKP